MIESLSLILRPSPVITAALATIAFAGIGVDASRASGREPTTLVMSRHIGWETDQTTLGAVCIVASKDECFSHKPSGEASGFEYPSSVATSAKTGDLYVADLDNHRVQEFTAAGTFVSMFGWDVNDTKSRQPGATQWERDVCTAVSGDRCKAGMSGTAAEQMTLPISITVDPVDGDVYVLEGNNGNDRVDRYTAGGRFVWTIGKGVNQATKGDLCTQREVEASKVRCKGGAENVKGGLEPAAFRFIPQYGDLLAIGGPEHLLYVGDEHRVQMFDAQGKWRGEIMLASIAAEATASVAALALDGEGSLYLVYRAPSIESGPHAEQAGIVRKFDREGRQIGQFAVNPRDPRAIAHIDGIAISPAGLMAVIGIELGRSTPRRFGSLYDPGTGRLLTEFTPPSDNDGLTFNDKGDLYVAATDDQEIIAYVPAPLAELATSLAPCEIAAGNDPRTTFNCVLNRV